jgi:hypothetical protein
VNVGQFTLTKPINQMWFMLKIINWPFSISLFEGEEFKFYGFVYPTEPLTLPGPRDPSVIDANESLLEYLLPYLVKIN